MNDLNTIQGRMDFGHKLLKDLLDAEGPVLESSDFIPRITVSDAEDLHLVLSAITLGRRNARGNYAKCIAEYALHGTDVYYNRLVDCAQAVVRMTVLEHNLTMAHDDLRAKNRGTTASALEEIFGQFGKFEDLGDGVYAVEIPINPQP